MIRIWLITVAAILTIGCSTYTAEKKLLVLSTILNVCQKI